jgi:hypothetical protein
MSWSGNDACISRKNEIVVSFRRFFIRCNGWNAGVFIV